MSCAAWLFWLSLLFIVYTYALYPVLIGIAARIRPRPVRRGPYAPPVSILIAAHNEAANIEARVENLLAQEYPADKIEIIVVSDGSTDGTPERLEALTRAHPRVRTLSLPANQGKASALNAGMEHARGELVVFTDARQRFAADALARLAENFADPAVGSASGELVFADLEDSAIRDPQSAISIGLYWRYEIWLRGRESRAGSMLGATGAIYAIRRELYRPLPAGAILDDFLTPMRIVLAGRRAILDGRAICYDRPSSRADQEMRRKVRTLAGNFQAFAIEPGLLLPWRNPSTWWQVSSHKLARLLVPYALIALLAGSFAAHGWLYRLAGAGQMAFYGLAAAGWFIERAGRPLRREISFAYTFTTLNMAAVLGFAAWLRGHGTGTIWRKAYGEKR